jgi:PQQ-dependent dehydrogenase (s-GDH family)
MNKLRALVTASTLIGISMSAAAHDKTENRRQLPAPSAPAATFELRVVTEGLQQPWEITWGPDGFLWVTERTGKRLVRVNPEDGSRSVALELTEAHQSAGQDGVLGLALHPNLLQCTGEDYVYVVFTYDAGASGTSAGSSGVLDRRTAIRRYEYDADTGTLGHPVDLIRGLPASNDHNSGRIKVGPDGKLYYTLGDQGNNQFDNKCRPILAQELPTQGEVKRADWTHYVGKILRLNLDGSIPRDNPRLGGVRSHVFTYGHRNAQGITFANGQLFETEHGPKSDDEVNRIQAGNNYGWPHIAGYRDDQAYVYGNWSAASDCTSLPFSDYTFPPSVPQATESSWRGNFEPPLHTFYTVPNDFNFQDPACNGNYYICWPTIAPSSIDFYEQHVSGIPGWKDSLLVTSLKRGAVFRLELERGGKTLGEPTEVVRTVDRYRDITLAPDGRSFFVVTDSDGQTSGPTTGFTSALEHPGSILEYRYVQPAAPKPKAQGRARRGR